MPYRTTFDVHVDRKTEGMIRDKLESRNRIGPVRCVRFFGYMRDERKPRTNMLLSDTLDLLHLAQNVS